MKYDTGAAAYDRFVGRWSRLYAVATLEAAGVKASDRVLDLATGTGDAALLAIQHVGPYGTTVGVDLSLPMLVVAKSKGIEARLNFVAADAQALPFRDRTFDAAICLSLSANMSETVTSLKFNVEGEQGLEVDERDREGAGGKRGAGRREGNATAVPGGVQAQDPARSGRL